jgi:hypothetical protein
MSISKFAKFIFIIVFLTASTQSNTENEIFTKTYNLETDREASLNEHFNIQPEFLRLLKEHDDSDPTDFYNFFPVTKAKFHNVGETVTFANDCFEKTKAELESVSKREAVIKFTVSEPINWSCSDSYLIATTDIHNVEMLFKKGEHRIVLTGLNEADLADIEVNGIKIIGFKDNFEQTVVSIIKTMKLYFGGFISDGGSNYPVPEHMETANVDFLERMLGYEQVHRGKWAKNIVDIDTSEIKSGDFLAITRLDGLDPMIMLGTGSHIGHSAVFLWIDDELYVLESQGGWYWPKEGIQKTRWDIWLKYAVQVDYMAAVLPLKDEYRHKFNEKKAIEWFKTVEGLHYGHHNFVFGWLDTESQNWPACADADVMMTILSIFSKKAEETAEIMFAEGLNHRLGTKGLSMIDAILKAAQQGISAGSLFAMPEKYDWEYSNGKSFVCAALVAALYKEAGIFDDLHIRPQEFVPRDIYQLNIFDLDYKRPKACKIADPDLPYCQIIGKYQINLNGYSTIEPYHHMNENCPSMAPHYERPDGC